MSEGDIEALNRSCYCVGVDRTRLTEELASRLPEWGLTGDWERTHPHLFSALPLFVSRRHLDTMASVVEAIERAVHAPVFHEAVLAWAPEVARHAEPVHGGALGLDFHLGAQSPRLIEINTNPGGALLNTVLARAQRVCCGTASGGGPLPAMAEAIEADLLQVFLEEWRAARGQTPLRTIAIIDVTPRAQYLYPEFLLYQTLFRRAGIEALICAPGELDRRDGALWHGGRSIDFVYNRLTDFALEEPAHRALRDAWLAGEVVLSPHPAAHALYADKRNLTLLGDRDFLRDAGVDAAAVEVLVAAVPHTVFITADNRDRLWTDRRRFFFKPVGGFGSRAAYRGDKLTRRVWEEIAASDYVAQAIVAPSERIATPGEPSVALKADIRNYAYDGRVLLVAARLYRGQTTNFRTEGGGFAPVFTDSVCSTQQRPRD